MNKGCVMEIRKNTMVIMTDDCLFTEIKKKRQAEVGTEILFHSTEIVNPKKGKIQPWMLMAASVLLVLITSLYGINLWQMNYQVHALLTVDINPSIQMEVNANNKVIKVTPLNEDAKTLPLQELKNQSVELALEELVNLSKEQGYIPFGDENYILVARILLKESKANLTGLQALIEIGKERIEQTAVEQGESISVVTIEAEVESLKKATEDKISVGKLEMYEKVRATTPEDIDMEEIKEKSIGEMMKQIDKAHPVFDEHPGNQKKNQDQLKEHPVFNEHPGNREKDNKQEQLDKKDNQDRQGKQDEKNEQGEKVQKGQKNHPVFEQHPGNQNKSRGKGTGPN
ncbi:hypothetical protein Amet_0088 [Alkaliphilus metalliredigens QYMF]|uniref:RsgI N-terminal anti-sigma domain-containing protein n=1 Tax=Alkaliphilus metalliredigens (strain QYMF) TaxID=293826 RepID=A6TJG3_ALKMQ|nr:anti-sigma factor domain-containing protein [Alkaliphilus metalliredigens]ABR46331.1 hypothetical protein Amet_0088 [Alkaliphilus metalliredigens QYMF]